MRALVSFDGFSMENGIPIYIQLLRYIKRGISAGVIKDGDELPSRRTLSALLGVNPNTVQKAYRMLEEEELICSHAGAKSFIQLNDTKINLVRKELIEREAAAFVVALRQAGLTKAEAAALIEDLWEQGEEQ